MCFNEMQCRCSQPFNNAILINFHLIFILQWLFSFLVEKNGILWRMFFLLLFIFVVIQADKLSIDRKRFTESTIFRSGFSFLLTIEFKHFTNYETVWDRWVWMWVWNNIQMIELCMHTYDIPFGMGTPLDGWL